MARINSQERSGMKGGRQDGKGCVISIPPSSEVAEEETNSAGAAASKRATAPAAAEH